ncbi:hypothetical protein FGK63_09915 [Ruegeria sediminis]|uniref:Uncharacterized protein n=1 Tax=Ruegeria sediminis TaxID=2583820 RepID=A0ABY2WZ46_9RHOB|nr:hypothetical protein [Ruegeria sediminis]TMV07772.1 hypothetical protein FGK63_09915 [Ruegeria sediminis]
MQKSMEEHQEEYRRQYRAVRPILEKHFASVDPQRIPGIIQLFLAEKEVALYESWNRDQQKNHLSRLRAQLRLAAESLSNIHPGVLVEVEANLTLPLEVLNGTYDRKTCAEEVFERAPSFAEVDTAKQVFRGLMSFSENIDKAIKYTQDELPVGIATGNRNIGAWKVVEAAVEVSRRYPDKMNVPKKMNGSGPLRRLLVDLFDLYNINANVDAAFNGWVEHIDRNREFLDLLPID